MKLYHFTSLLHLPQIMREGLTRGEVPIGPYPRKQRPTAVNLTKDGTLRTNSGWNEGNYFDKTRVRLVVDVPEDELVSFRTVRRDYDITKSWLKALTPNREHKFWYFATEPVSVDRITQIEIAFKKPGCFQEVADDQLQSILNAVEEEKSRLPIFDVDGVLAVTPKVFSIGSWLIDGPLVVQQWPDCPL